MVHGLTTGPASYRQRRRATQPVYPKHLIAARIQGVVTVQAIVDRAGCVSRATVVGSAHPELDISALAAVVQRR